MLEWIGALGFAYPAEVAAGKPLGRLLGACFRSWASFFTSWTHLGRFFCVLAFNFGFFIDFGRFWGGFRRVWGGFWEGLGRLNRRFFSDFFSKRLFFENINKTIVFPRFFQCFFKFNDLKNDRILIENIETIDAKRGRKKN